MQMLKSFYREKVRNSLLGDFFLKNFAFIFKHKYLSNRFWNWYYFLEKAQYWDKTKVENYQIERIKYLVNYAFLNTDYYSMKFNEYGVRPNDIQNLNDLKKLPFTDRHIFMQEKEKMISRNFDLKRCKHVKTSGTTANPLVFYQQNDYFPIELATIYHFWNRIGFNPNEKRAVLNGDILPDRRPWIYSEGNYLRMSPNKISKDRVKLYIKVIEQYGAKYLHGYPSAISLMAKVIKEESMAIPFNLSGVFLASEPIYQWQRNIINEVFNCRVFSHYGNTEGVALAGECENSSIYHFSPFFSYVELDENTNEIIGTAFWNFVNPFIRHKTKDIAKPLVKMSSCTCGRNGLLIESVEGRQGDYLVSLNGEYIFPQAVTWILVGIETIKETQIIQKTDHSIIFRYTPYSFALKENLKNDLTHIKNRIIEMVGGHIKIEFEQKEFIENSARGKVRWIRSEISEGLIEKGL